jgi:histidinol-phosphate aminotransferase
MARPAIDFINPLLRAQPPVGVNRIDPSLHRMQWNENPFDFPPDLKEEVLRRLAQQPWSRYPLGGRAFDLIDALAEFHGLRADQVVVGSGSSDLLRVVTGAVLQPGDHMVVPAPTFPAYRRHAQTLGATVHEVMLDPEQGFSLPVDLLLAQAAEHQAKLIVVCTPNNPTGTVYSFDQLRRLAAESDALVMFDCAYAEFSGQDLRPLLAAHDNVVLVHTLSKCFALAGARIGYALAAPTVAAELQKLITVFTLSLFSEAVGMVAVQNFDRFQSAAERLVAERERLAQALAALPGVHVFPSGTNFLLVRLDRPAKGVVNALHTQSRVLVAEANWVAGYDNYLRISVGAPDENELVVKALAAQLAAQPA